MNGSRRREIAARLRIILALETPTPADVSRVALELDVDEVPLRMSIDPDTPYPTVDVLAAVVERHGIDPTYLLTGVYDIDTHRRALGDPSSVASAIREAAGTRSSGPVATPPTEPPRLHLL